jgi:hypothetical protein
MPQATDTELHNAFNLQFGILGPVSLVSPIGPIGRAEWAFRNMLGSPMQMFGTLQRVQGINNMPDPAERRDAAQMWRRELVQYILGL